MSEMRARRMTVRLWLLRSRPLFRQQDSRRDSVNYDEYVFRVCPALAYRQVALTMRFLFFIAAKRFLSEWVLSLLFLLLFC